nr:ArsI/CadI family heavy metal resistance metalloenzyme [Polymorphobacter sp.]
MKRMHVHVGVDDLAQSVRFYSALFAAEPVVQQPDYAKWMLEDPRLNFAISLGHATRGIEHIGIQVETAAELAEVRARLDAAQGPILDEVATSCCYAKSDKSWISDPQGVIWETFLTTGNATDYGVSPDLPRLATGANAAENTCCAPALLPAPVFTPTTSCCG